MKARYLLAGISAMAFAATAATAQNTNSANSSGGTGNTATCTNNSLGSTGNVCTIDVIGSNNVATVTQAGNNNNGNIDVLGNNNNAQIVQPGASNSGSITQNGNDGTAYLVQSGRWNTASVTQDGGLQVADVRQASTGVTTNGNGNRAAVAQNGTGDNNHDHSQVFVQQSGERNTVSVTQRPGSVHNTSNSIQGGAVNADGTTVDARTGVNNALTVDQAGQSNFAYTEQRGTAAGSTVSNNNATHIMGGGLDQGFNGSQQNFSSITQTSSGNAATSVVFGGTLTSGQGNTSLIVQRNDTQASSVSAANEAFASLSQGEQMLSDIDQNGRNNYAEVTMTDGLAGTNSGPGAVAPEAGLSGGNTAVIDQVGNGSTAVVTTGSTQNFRGLGNSVTISQTATQAYGNQTAARANEARTASEGRIAYTEFQRTGASGNFTGANGQYVETWQQGRFDTANITQTDNANGSGVDYGNGVTGRARAGVYQSSSVGTVTVTQAGDNYGEVTQANGQGSTATLNQTDAGDIANPPTVTPVPDTCDAFGNCFPNPPIVTPNPPTRQFNFAILTQNGTNNAQTVTQNTRDGYATTFQRVGSSGSVISIDQGVGNTSLSAGANFPAGNVYAGNPLQVGAPSGAGTRALTANVEQGGANNFGVVRQDGTTLFATVQQLGSGTALNANTGTGFGGGGGGNVVIVLQQGTNNRATARQNVNVGASTALSPSSGNDAAANAALGDPAVNDEFYFAGGSRSPEIDIIQAGSNNTAEVDQRGKGQYARIDQGPGSGNTADIVQEQLATNATAVIRQSGSNNSYYVVQTAPGQYISVEQNGNGNAATNIIQRGPAGGSHGFTAQPGS